MIDLAGKIRETFKVRIPYLKLAFPTLPEGLVGLKILQISDMHLAKFVTLNSLADLLKRAEGFAPDIVVVTGDIVDDMRLLPETLRRLGDFPAPLGVHAILGNHEHKNGLDKVLAAFQDSKIPLLVNRTVKISVGGALIHLGGIDDFAGNKGEFPTDARFYSACLEKVFPDPPAGEFRLLLSHRPNVFPVASRHRIDLTLSGHTHGFQLGYGRRSLIHFSKKYPFPWGHYQLGASQLYTTAGAGHWIPVRLGCPAEAPVLELGK
jgi:uncharacterized protein